jgi:hypothetical protein
MMAALSAWPVAAANALSNDDFLAMTNSQANETDMPDSSKVQQSAQEAAVVNGDAESTEITAARLGVMTPYGKRALVQELRNYYPGSYRDFRSLSSGQVDELVVLFEQSGDLNQVLARMDHMGVE